MNKKKLKTGPTSFLVGNLRGAISVKNLSDTNPDPVPHNCCSVVQEK